eukprot:COSAG02_NODE_290_length_25531_cov_75.132392_8_plen_379_part_00
MFPPPPKRPKKRMEQQVTYRGRPKVPNGVAPGATVLGGPDDDVKGPCAFMHGLCAHRVAENLFLGSREAAERPSAELAALGISAVVNCTRDGAADGVPCVHEADGVEYCRVGVHDNESADILSYLGIAASWIAARRSIGQSVLVHCQMGRSRSATIAIAALMAAEGLSRDAAYLKVKGARPMAEPNQGFWEQLAKFETELHAKSAAALSGEARAAADTNAAAAPKIDDEWLQRSLARFEFAPSDIAAGLPASEDGMKLVVSGGVDRWLGRGCDPSTGRWLHALLQHAFSGESGVAAAAAAAAAARAGAVGGLRETILSPEYMADWACELRQQEVAALGSLLREAPVHEIVSLVIEEEAAADDGPRIVREIIVASQRAE